jgi:orotidine-5'-phosphate decarboxylase
MPEGERAMLSNSSDKLTDAIRTKKSILCVGLDFQLRYLPPHLKEWVATSWDDDIEATVQLARRFFCDVIDIVKDVAVAVKPNLAFLECYGHRGIWAFEKIISHAHSNDLLVVADGKRNDGGDTADAYADGYLGQVSVLQCQKPCSQTGPIVSSRVDSPVRADWLTVTPYIGEACIEPFVKRVKEFGKGIFVVTKTSFKPNSAVENLMAGGILPVWEMVARMVGEWGEGTKGACGLSNVGVVMGATYPEDAPKMRRILPYAWFLIPGYGAQGGGADAAVIGVREDGLGGVVNSSRGITYAYMDKQGKLLCEDTSEACLGMVRQAALKSRDELVEACKKAGKWRFFD